MIDYPPILQGSPYLQLQSLRDYLVRMAEELQTVAMAADNSVRALGGQTVAGIEKRTQKSVDDSRASLRSLITKTAAVIESHVDAIETELHSDYVAESEFGTYREQVEAQFTATAEGVTEAYSKATTAQAGLDSFKTELEGEIRRGVITDPETGRDIIGIAISQKLYFEEGGNPVHRPRLEHLVATFPEPDLCPLHGNRLAVLDQRREGGLVRLTGQLAAPDHRLRHRRDAVRGEFCLAGRWCGVRTEV